MNFFLDVSETQIVNWIVQYWLIPVGLIALYFYATFHFNTPDYDVFESTGGNQSSISGMHLISLAPPRYTTTRRRFRRYAIRYVCLLETAFLLAVFGWPILQIAAKQKDAPLPPIGDLQTRAIWALFTLTGLLSSFPYVKDIDTWILKRLHEGALIPKGARTFAEDLFDAPLVPQAVVATEVRRLLQRRDTIRVAEGKAAGSLETMILRTMWLRSGLKAVTSTTNEAEVAFKVRMLREMESIEQSAETFIKDVRRYLQEQERIIPHDVIDIDESLEVTLPGHQDLLDKRADLLHQARVLYFRMCVLSTMFINIVTKSPAEASAVLRKIGFGVEVQLMPVWNFEALFSIGLGAFFAVLGVGTFILPIYNHFGLLAHPVGTAGPGRRAPFVFSLIAAVLYSLVIGLARALKRRWSRTTNAAQDRPRNLIIAFYSYAVCVIIAFILGSLFAPGDVVNHAEMAASQLAFLAGGYFAGIYVDRELRGDRFSIGLASLQAGAQFLAALIGARYVMPDPPFPVTDAQQLAFFIFLAMQSGLVGLVVGCMTQLVYRSSRPPISGTSFRRVGDVAVVGITGEGSRMPGLAGLVSHAETDLQT